MRSASWLILLSVWMVVCSFISSFAQTGKDAKAVFESIAKHYDSAKTFAMSAKVVTEIVSGKSTIKITSKVRTWTQKPDKFKVVTESANPQGKTVRHVILSDGTYVFTEIPNLQQTLRNPISELKKAGGISGSFFNIEKMSELADELKDYKIVGKEKLGNRMTQVIKATTKKDENVFQFWVADNDIWQIRFTMNTSKMLSQPGQTEQTNAQKITATVTITIEQQELNPKLPPNIFVYKPPPGYKVVDKLQYKQPTSPPTQP